MQHVPPETGCNRVIWSDSDDDEPRPRIVRNGSGGAATPAVTPRRRRIDCSEDEDETATHQLSSSSRLFTDSDDEAPGGIHLPETMGTEGRCALAPAARPPETTEGAEEERQENTVSHARTTHQSTASLPVLGGGCDSGASFGVGATPTPGRGDGECARCGGQLALPATEQGMEAVMALLDEGIGRLKDEHRAVERALLHMRGRARDRLPTCIPPRGVFLDINDVLGQREEADRGAVMRATKRVFGIRANPSPGKIRRWEAEPGERGSTGAWAKELARHLGRNEDEDSMACLVRMFHEHESLEHFRCNVQVDDTGAATITGRMHGIRSERACLDRLASRLMEEYWRREHTLSLFEAALSGSRGRLAKETCPSSTPRN